MVGGGPGGFIGAVHRMAARLDDHFELVAAALSSDPERSRAAALDLHIAADRAYRSFAEMASAERADRKSTRLNSSHVRISYAVFCLKKKKKNTEQTVTRDITK